MLVIRQIANPEWLAQVSAADKLLVSKKRSRPTEEAAALRKWLRQLNPLAELGYPAGAGCACVVIPKRSRSRLPEQRVRWLGACAEKTFTLMPTPYSEAHPATQTCVISLKRSLNWPAFAIWLSMLLHCHGSAVLRVKGILRVSDSDSPVVIHGVQHTLHPPVHLRDWPGTLESSTLVFILRGLEASSLQQAFSRYMHLLQES